AAPGFKVPSASVVGNPVRVFPQSTAIPQSQRGMNVLFSSGLKMFTEGDHVSEAPKITGVQWPDGTIDEVKIVRTDGGPLFEHEIVNGVDVWFMKPGEQLLPNGRRLPLGARAIFVRDSMQYELVSDEGDLKLTLAAVDDILNDSK
ncbi:MAG: hypothetical protein Q8K99_05990, partial [Actinomycetota bacterium]|nr:hypothetical protein [Actinomycetota bacterium]